MYLFVGAGLIAMAVRVQQCRYCSTGHVWVTWHHIALERNCMEWNGAELHGSEPLGPNHCTPSGSVLCSRVTRSCGHLEPCNQAIHLYNARHADHLSRATFRGQSTTAVHCNAACLEARLLSTLLVSTLLVSALPACLNPSPPLREPVRRRGRGRCRRRAGGPGAQPPQQPAQQRPRQAHGLGHHLPGAPGGQQRHGGSQQQPPRGEEEEGLALGTRGDGWPHRECGLFRELKPHIEGRAWAVHASLRLFAKL